MSKKLSYNYVKEYIEYLGYILLTEEYKNNTSKIILKDKNDFYYVTTFTNLKSGNNTFMVHKSNPYSIQNIKTWVSINHKPFELISNEYEKNNKKLQWKCLKDGCGEIFEANWANISQGKGCSYCHGFSVGLSNCLTTKNPELAKQWHPTKNGNLTPYDVTEYSNKKVWWQCTKNSEHEWKIKISNRKYNNCPYCSNKLPSNDYNLLVVNPNLCKEWDYTKNKKKPEEYLPNSNKKAWWICKDCGHEWKSLINNRNTSGNGCPECNKSKGERKIKDYLLLKNIYFERQYMFNNCKNTRRLPFDFIIFEDKTKTKIKMLIEYDGILHYEDKFNNPKQFERNKINDAIKDQYCQNNNIKLLRIPYWDFDNIEDILKKHLFK